MEEAPELKVTPAKKVGLLKRKAKGAEKTIATCDKTIKLLQQQLKEPKLSFSERQFIKGKISKQKIKRYEAQKNYRSTDSLFRAAVQQNNKIQRGQLQGQRYEDRYLPDYDQYWLNWKIAIVNAAKNDSMIRQLQIELTELAGGDQWTEFKKKTLAMLEKVDPKPAKLLSLTKRLKSRLLGSLDAYFGDHPAHLPEPRQKRLEDMYAQECGEEEGGGEE